MFYFYFFDRRLFKRKVNLGKSGKLTIYTIFTKKVRDITLVPKFKKTFFLKFSVERGEFLKVKIFFFIGGDGIFIGVNSIVRGEAPSHKTLREL